MTKILAKADGKTSEHEVGEQPLVVICHQAPIKIEVPEALLVDPAATSACMRKMSQKAWEHISTGPLFLELFNQLFQDDPIKLPEKIETLIADYDEGIIHACGLVILLVESRLNGVEKVFIKTPETHLHPRVQRHIMDVVKKIQDIPGPDDGRMGETYEHTA